MINVSVRTGNFNFVNPQEEQCLISARIDTKNISCAVDLQNESYYNSLINENPITAIKEAYTEEKKRYLYDSAANEKADFIKFISENEDKILKEWASVKIIEINKKIESLSKQKTNLYLSYILAKGD